MRFYDTLKKLNWRFQIIFSAKRRTRTKILGNLFDHFITGTGRTWSVNQLSENLHDSWYMIHDDENYQINGVEWIN